MSLPIGQNWGRGRKGATGLLSILLFTLLMALLSMPNAYAGGHESGRERAARKACLGGDYAKGVSILSDLFLDTKDATFIYNQGRCLEQNGRFGDAIFRFQEYLRVASDLTEADKQETQKHIADCQAQTTKQAGSSETATPTPVVAPAQAGSAPPPAAPTAASLPVATAQAASARPSDNGSGLRLGGWVTAGVGVTALATGVVFNLKVNSIASDYQNRGGYTAAKESDRSTYETLGWISYGVGAAAVATGAVLYFWGPRPIPTATIAS